MPSTLVEKPAPLFVAGTVYGLGEWVTLANGSVVEKRTKASKITAPPTVGATWALVKAAPAGEGPVTWRNLDTFRTSANATTGAIYFLNEPGKEDNFRCIGKTDKADDGVFLLVNPTTKVGYERLWDNFTVLASWYDVVPDRPDLATPNALNLDRAIKENNFFRLLLPGRRGTPPVYHLNHVPGSGAFVPTKEESCITICDRVMILEFAFGVTAETETGYKGYQAYERYERCYPIRKRVTLRHKGGREAVREHGALRDDKGNLQVDKYGRLVYSQNWGNDYKISGGDQWCAGEIWGGGLHGYPGNGHVEFGQKGVRVPSVVQPVTGTVDYWNGDMFLRPDKAKDLAALAAGSCAVVLEGLESRNSGWIRDNGTVTLGYGTPESTGLPSGAKVQGTYARTTRDFFADFVLIMPLDGWFECNFNGGCGGFRVGAECNHGLAYGVSCRNNGGWSWADWSFLGGCIYGLHSIDPGEHFNTYYERPIGGFTTGNNPNSRALAIYSYRETGCGPDQLSGRAGVIGGMTEVGVVGGFSLLDGYTQGIKPADYSIESFGAGKPLAMRALRADLDTAIENNELVVQRATQADVPPANTQDARQAYVDMQLMTIPS